MPIKKPSHAMPESANKIGWLVKKKWVRELILLPITLTGKRRYNKTEDYGVFRDNSCIISNMEQCSYYVTDIAESREWFEKWVLPILEPANLNHILIRKGIL